MIVIRTDSSSQAGTGHVMRCLTLADYLRLRGLDVRFICGDLPGNIISDITAKDYKVHILPRPGQQYEKKCELDEYQRWLSVSSETDRLQTEEILKSQTMADWLIVDNYALDKEWETPLRKFAGNIMVIDDLANREHDCDILLDQNLHINMENRYRDLVPQSCRQLLGPQYSLLRKEFYEAGQINRERNGQINRILVFFGGVDANDITSKALEALLLIKKTDMAIDVIVGQANPYKEKICQWQRKINNLTIHSRVNDMAKLMLKADIAIGGGGTTTWERAWLGLPSIVVILAENQRSITQAMENAGAVWNLGVQNNITPDRIIKAVEKAMFNPDLVRDMSLSGKKIFGEDTRPGAEKLFQAIKETQNVMAR